MTTSTEALRAGVRVEPARGLTFSGTVRAEVQKILGQRSTPVLLVIGVVGFVATMLLLTLGTQVSKEMAVQPVAALGLFQDTLYLLFSVGSGIFLLLGSARLVGMEYSQGTLRILLARGTGRVQLLVAKLIALFSLGVVLLAGYVLVSAVWIGLATLHWTGSLSALTAGGPGTARDLGLGLVLALLSMACGIVIGSTTATLGRSVAFGVGAAMGLFPADNFGTVILQVISQLTHQKFWAGLTAYLLGPNLNVLPGLAITNRHVQTALISPAVKVTLGHTLLVIGVWTVGLLVVELVLTWRRDVLA